MTEARRSLAELAGAVNAWCETHHVRPVNGQASLHLNERNLRFYRTIGLLDGPCEGGGYGEKHRLQLVAIRLLQAQGLPLRRIRDLLLGRPESELREIERRGIAAVQGAQPRWPDHLTSEAGRHGGHWWTAPLSDEVLVVSLRGRAVPPLAMAKLRQVLVEAMGADQHHTQKPESHAEES